MADIDERAQEECEERMAFETAIVNRMLEKGLLADADYVKASFGLNVKQESKS